MFRQTLGSTRTDTLYPYRTLFRSDSRVEAGVHTAQLDVGVRGRNFWVAPADYQRAKAWFSQGYTEALKTPDDTIVYVTPESRRVIQQDQKDCMGCLSHCQFSSWKDHDDYRSEEHTSELQSLMRISYAVFCLKKKKSTEQS